MKQSILLLTSAALLCFGCKKEEPTPEPQPAVENSKVLMLKVDYLTNTFMGGKELVFESGSANFTIANEYQPPGDFGNLKLTFQELNQPLFEGSIIWMGCGAMTYPTSLQPASDFEAVVTTDVVMPSGFENVFNPSNETYDYGQVWMGIQNRVKVRQYLAAIPQASVKLFLYTPSVGIGDPNDWYWIVFLKN